jgi:hypothetical protein
MATQLKPKFANEYLDLIEKAKTEEEKIAAMKQYGSFPPLNFLLSMCYNDKVQFELPAGMPPYQRDEATHFDLFSPLASQIRRMQLCLKSNGNTPRFKKEIIFIQLLEAINPKEADIIVACKDRALTELYPSITKELVAKVFPAYVSK